MANKIETERLILREWTFADISDMVDGLNNYEVSKYFGTPFPYTTKDAEEYIKKTKKLGNKSCYFAIALKESDKAIGGCGIHFKEDHVSIGIWLNEKFHGQGYGSEASRSLCKYGFDELGIEKYDSVFFEGNIASIRIQEKVGSKIACNQDTFCPTQGEKPKLIKAVLTKEEFI